MNKYRDELVAIIKDMGQELIDRAEEMVAPNAELIGEFNIDICIPNPREEAPSIVYSTTTFCKNFEDRKCSAKLDVEATMLKPREPFTSYWHERYDFITDETVLTCNACSAFFRHIGRLIDLPSECPNCSSTMLPREEVVGI